MHAADLSPYVVLDDDPTGVQTLAGVRVLLAWDPDRIAAALEGRRAVHLITNTRALAPDRVQTSIEEAARAARAASPRARLVLRGDSTLRGHVREEYLGVRQVTTPGGWPILLLVPALPSAGRITREGVHLFVRDGIPTPLHETEYARDGVFAYSSSRLLHWAEERSGGLFASANGEEIHLDSLRSGGPETVAAALGRLAAPSRPAALVPDAENEDDLALIARGYERALARGIEVTVRCAPAFAGIVAGTTASGPVSLPHGEHVLLVCGSHVPQTTRQLARLLDAYPSALVEADVGALVGRRADTEVERVGAAATAVLNRDGLVVVATPRELSQAIMSLEAGGRVAAGLARVVSWLGRQPDVVIAKGGITSAVTLREGVGAAEADVLGPVEPGVSLWAAKWPDGSALDYLVVPGNVGDDDVLERLVTAIMRGSRSC